MGTGCQARKAMALPCCTSISSSERGVNTTCGKYSGSSLPGLALYCWPWQEVYAQSVRVEQLDVETETKTLDNVSVTVCTAIQYQIETGAEGTTNPDLTSDNLYKSFFLLDNPRQQMTAYVDDVVRSELPTRSLDQAYEEKAATADYVKKVMQTAMGPYGFTIAKVLITELKPDARVQAAMNEINTQKRQRAAAQEKAEADKLIKVKAAEADKEAKRLTGVGIARMRTAITNGFQTSIKDMKDACGLEASDVVHMMLVTQYMDTLKDFATSGKSSIVMSHTPDAMGEIEAQLRSGFADAKVSMAGSNEKMRERFALMESEQTQEVVLT